MLIMPGPAVSSDTAGLFCFCFPVIFVLLLLVLLFSLLLFFFPFQAEKGTAAFSASVPLMRSYAVIRSPGSGTAFGQPGKGSGQIIKA